MDIQKVKNDIVLSKLNQQELFGLLKSQINCKLVFQSQAEDNLLSNYEIFLLERSALQKGAGTQAIKISIDGKQSTVSYDTLLSHIVESSTDALLTVVIPVMVFSKKEPLIQILGKVKAEIIDNCVSLEYDNGMFSIIYRKLPDGSSSKLHYWEENNSVLGFSEAGPVLIYDSVKFQSIEDIIC